jgi:hypothetical protein
LCVIVASSVSAVGVSNTPFNASAVAALFEAAASRMALMSETKPSSRLLKKSCVQTNEG